MSRVMRVGPNEDVWDRAQRELRYDMLEGRVPMQWTLGRETLMRLKATAGPMVRDCPQPMNKLLGLPFEVSRQGPPDLLELDSF